MSRARLGVTLIELVVALAIIGISSAMALLAWRSPTVTDASGQDPVAMLVSEARRVAVSSGRPQRVSFRLTTDGTVLDEKDSNAGGRVHRLVALPDGSVIADSGLRVERLGGHATRTSQNTR